MQDKTAFQVPLAQRQLFLDDYGIAKIENLRRTLHQPDKKGAVIKPDRPWETTLQTRCAPAWDPIKKVYKLWMITSGNFPELGNGGTTYAESQDGVHWTKPALRQITIHNSAENNFVNLGADLRLRTNMMENVVYDPLDKDPSRRFKGLANCLDREPVVSADGIHWKLLNVPKIPSNDESNLSYDPKTRTFIATLKYHGHLGRSVNLSTSKDFEHWTEPELIFHADELDQTLGRENIAARLADPTLQRPFSVDPAKYQVDVYNMGVSRYEGLYVGFPAMYHATGPTRDGSNTDGFHLVQLVCSRDLKTWDRLGERKAFIGPSQVASAAYDLTQILPPSSPVVRGDELWFYYTGLKYRDPPEGTKDKDGGAICLAVLRRDGFVSLDAGAQPGVLLTQSFAVPGAKLFVNADAPQGEIRAEVLDPAGNVAAASASLTGDLPRGVVQWRQGNLANLKGQHVSLRFTLRNARFYSYGWEA